MGSRNGSGWPGFVGTSLVRSIESMLLCLGSKHFFDYNLIVFFHWSNEQIPWVAQVTGWHNIWLLIAKLRHDTGTATSSLCHPWCVIKELFKTRVFFIVIKSSNMLNILLSEKTSVDEFPYPTTDAISHANELITDNVSIFAVFVSLFKMWV